MINLHVGDIIDRDILKRDIKRAFKKGIFLDIEAVAEPYEDGIKLKYIVDELPVVKHIGIEGNSRISKRQIKKAFIFRKDEDFKEDLLDSGRILLQHFYFIRGFRDARVKIGIEKDKASNKVNINIQIREGEPLVIKSINILPEAGNHIKLSKGDIFDMGRVENDIERLKRYYRKQKNINPVIGNYEFKDGELTIPITPGPGLEVVFKGNAIFGSKKLLNEVTFLDDKEVTGELVQDAAYRIERLYQKKGYNYIQVSGGIEKEENLIRVIFFIFEGKKTTLREIKFEGINISPEAVKAIIPLRERKPFDMGLLNASRESIIGFYNALGYLEADVKEIKEDFLRDVGELSITFIVHQGPQTKVKKINITGNMAVSTSEIKKVLQINLEDPFNEIDIGDAQYRILSLYSKIGYINAEVEAENILDNGSATVTFKITEGEPFVFGKIIIRGNEKTKDKIIRREFLIEEGEPYHYEALFLTRQHLYKLGLFTDISIKPLESSGLKRSDREKEKTHIQDVLIDLKEGNPGAVELGVGYGDYEKLRGFFDISYSNLGGYNRRIGLRAELNSIESRYLLNFREPWLFNKPSLPLNVSLVKENIKSVNIDTREIRYKVNKLSLLVGVEKELTSRLKASLNYEYTIVKTTDVEPGVVLSKEDIGTLGISSIYPSLFYDSRDNPFNPASGFFGGIVLKFASRAFLSETEFVKVVFQNAWYSRIKKGLIFAFALKGGIAHGFGDTVELPIVERFFLGGRTTVRGYDHDTLGPKGADDSPTGGNIFALANGELRISLGRGFGMVTFIDAGNVWKKISEVNSVLRYTAGLGLRYITPVGPVRLDYGHKLNRESGESAGEIHFSFGHAF
ncbi:MAG: outer membrane protein assembly factor BamA [Candidatus Mariimomonas ferrooxydans]